MNSIKNTTFEPDWVTSPGETLREILEAKGMTKWELAHRANISVQHVNRMILGSTKITSETAILLERVLGVSAKFWIAREVNYQIRNARLKSQKRLAKDTDILKKPVVKELMKRNIVPKGVHRTRQIESLLSFFGVGSVKQLQDFWDEPYQIALRHSPTLKSNSDALAAWIRIGERKAEHIHCERYDEKTFLEALTEIRKLTTLSPEQFIPQMVELCAHSGVALVFVKEISGARLHGATRWLNPNKAMIILNLRGKKNDIFWFTFFHETCHVLYDDRETLTLDGNDVVGKGSESEKRADIFAANFLIPEEYAENLTELTLSQIKKFAESIGVHPGIVAGRLGHERIFPFSKLNQFRDSFQWGG
jgi:HTH-type transcriptional regulator/antitoxin HigA